jgi:membrane protease YdiL (CAAX protease family)
MTDEVDLQRGQAARERKWLLVLVGLYALAALIYVLMPDGAMTLPESLDEAGLDLPAWQLGLANAALILLVYGTLGLIGLWLARKAGLPGLHRSGADRRALIWRPLQMGISVGIVLVLSDTVARLLTDFAGFPHPPFPASILASFTAGVGEELIFRLVVMSLWTIILSWLFSRLVSEGRARRWALWGANAIGALAFAAAHLGTATVVFGTGRVLTLPPVVLAEILALNGLLGVVAGVAFVRDGLVAACGIHFWADVVWHVIYGLLSNLM